jgi:hypothetical protein
MMNAQRAPALHNALLAVDRVSTVRLERVGASRRRRVYAVGLHGQMVYDSRTESIFMDGVSQ